jgi:hypothetical protein
MHIRELIELYLWTVIDYDLDSRFARCPIAELHLSESFNGWFDIENKDDIINDFWNIDFIGDVNTITSYYKIKDCKCRYFKSSVKSCKECKKS